MAIEKKFSHAVFRMWERIFNHFSSVWVEAPHLVHVIRCVPNFVVLIYTKSIRTRLAARQLVFLKSFRSGIEPGDLARKILAKPYASIGTHLDPSWLTLRRRRPRLLLSRTRDPVQLPIIPEATGPDVIVLIDNYPVEAAGVSAEPGKFLCFGVETVERVAGTPDESFRINANSVGASARGSLILGDFLRLGIQFTDFVLELFRKPNGAVPSRNRRMYPEDIWTGDREVLKIAGFRVKPRYFIDRPVVGDPHASIFVRSRTPGKLPSDFVL